MPSRNEASDRRSPSLARMRQKESSWLAMSRLGASAKKPDRPGERLEVVLGNQASVHQTVGFREDLGGQSKSHTCGQFKTAHRSVGSFKTARFSGCG